VSNSIKYTDISHVHILEIITLHEMSFHNEFKIMHISVSEFVDVNSLLK